MIPELLQSMLLYRFLEDVVVEEAEYPDVRFPITSSYFNPVLSKGK